jgi:hypothetical protein
MFQLLSANWRCGQGWIRTTELRRGQIYSLLPLATWLLAQRMQIPNIASQISTHYQALTLGILPEPLVGIEPTTY